MDKCCSTVENKTRQGITPKEYAPLFFSNAMFVYLFVLHVSKTKVKKEVEILLNRRGECPLLPMAISLLFYLTNILCSAVVARRDCCSWERGVIPLLVFLISCPL